MTKVYVLDTSALINDSELLFELEENCEIIIPDAAVKEIYGHKRNSVIRIAAAAREVANTLHLLGRNGELDTGVALPTGAILRTYGKYEAIDDLVSEADNRIVGAAISLKKEFFEVKLLTTDTNMRTIARSYGLAAEVPPVSADKVML